MSIGHLARKWLGVCAGVAACIVSVLPIGPVEAAAASLLSHKQFEQIRSAVQQDVVDYAGVTADDQRHIVYVYRVSSRVGTPKALAASAHLAQIQAAKDAFPKVWKVSFVDVAHSMADLKATQAAITTREPWATDVKPFLAAWWADPATNAVHVGVSQITARVASDAREFGGLVHLAIQGRPGPTSRTADYAPWWGGDSLTGPAGNGCTGGFGVIRRSNGHYGMLTAGHCFNSNDTVNQNGNKMGTVTWRVYGGSSYDAEFIDAAGGVQPEVYTSLYGAHQVDAYSRVPQVGEVICVDGLVTGQNCTAKVVVTDICIYYQTPPAATVCHMDMVSSTNGSTLTQHGDSGGPLYRYDNNSGVIAYGLISGNDNLGNASHNGYFTPFGPDINSTLRLVCQTATNC